MILQELSKRHKHWLNIAYNISKDKELSKDLVQDMYLKVYYVSQKRTLDINDYYIVIVLRNLFIDYCRLNNKNVRLDDCFNLEIEYKEFEINDEQLKILNKLTYLERELLKLNQTMSYREIQRQLNINYQFARRVILKAQEKYGKTNKR